MTTLTLDLEQFTKALETTSNKTLGWVRLQSLVYSADELTPPDYTPDPPTIMPAFVLVASPSYRLVYKTVRYARFCYLLERDGTYEAGELTALHDLVIADIVDDEGVPPVEPLPFIPPTISTGQVVTIGSVGSLGVSFSFIHDSGTNGNDAKFGLAYKITNALPAIYPRLVLSYITAISPEDI